MTGRSMHSAALGLVALAATGTLACGGRGGSEAAGVGPPSAAVESGFVVDKDAFNFPNFGGFDETSELTPGHLTRMFGGDAICGAGAGANCQPSPIAREYIAKVNQSMLGGRCEGFAILSGLMFLGDIKVSDFGGTAARTLSLDGNEALAHEIGYWFSTQYLRNVVKTTTKSMHAIDAVEFLAAEYAKPGHDMYRIGMVRVDADGRRGGGHAILATAVVPGASAHEFTIKVYDNNHPGAERAIKIDTSTNRWEYQASTDPDATVSLYAGDPGNKNPLYVSGVRPRLGQHDCLFCSANGDDPDKALNQIFTFGSAAVHARDSSGRVTGELNGQIVTGIPGSVAAPEFRGGVQPWLGQTPWTLIVPSQGPLAINIQPAGNTPPGEMVNVTSFLPGAMVGVQNAAIAQGSSESIQIGADGRTFNYFPSPGNSPTFVAASQTMPGQQTMVRLQIPAERQVSNASITIDPATGNADLQAKSSEDAPLAIEVTRSSSLGEQTFNGIVTVPPAGTTTLLVNNWQGPGTSLPAAIDQNGDGMPEQMVAIVDTGPVTQPPPSKPTCALISVACGHGHCDDATGTLTCVCDAGYAGPDCMACGAGYQDNDKNGSCTATCATSGLAACGGRGVCADDAGTAACACNGDWGGPLCETPMTTCTATTCANGTCSDGTGRAVCSCTPGFSGSTCAINLDDCAPNPCQNDGACADGVNVFSCTCPAGYAGPTCTTNVNECSPNPCLNNGTCTDAINAFACVCRAGFTGATCATNVDDCASNPCQNGGTCTDDINAFACTCPAGFAGATCTTNVDECASSPCQNGGTCTDGVNAFTCTCLAGFTGSTCAGNVDECASNPCQNGGTCADGVNAFTCTCPTGFAGATCSTNIDECSPNPCQNGGTCTDGVNAFTCTCPTGFAGATCSTNVDECSPNPCQNGGTCTDGVNAFTCTCPAGFSNPVCGTNVDDCAGNPCQNGGACTDGVDAFTCACPAGYSGATCATNVDECAPNPCQNGGTCTDGVNAFTCACPAGYSGATCATNIDECAANPCSNGGTCTDGVNAFTCTCPAGYSGATCGTNIDECAGSPCSNGGTCTDGVNAFTCSCAAGYSGATCATNTNDCAPNPCSNGGTCTDGVNAFTCSCAAGYSGATCGTNVDECAGNPCSNGGTCTDGVNAFTCSCAAGYSGATCATNVDDCAGNPCSNGGTCTDGVNAFTCSCAAGYSGATCGINIDECAGNPCSNGGMCTDGVNAFTCNCAAGYSGATCATNIDDCVQSPCLNGGTCADGVASFSCMCASGFSDATCSTNIDDCSPDPCVNGGVCQDGVASFTCACPPGFGGPTCADPLMCQLVPFIFPRTFFGECPGCGTSGASWNNAKNAAVASCQGSCAGTCSVSTGAGDNCGFDGMINGYWCRSLCSLPTYVYEGTGADWATAHTAAEAACASSGCADTCSTSMDPMDACEDDPRLPGVRCRSTCVCD